MKLFKKEQKVTEPKKVYAIRVLEDGYKEALDLLRKGFNKRDICMTDTAVKIDGADVEAVRLTFESNDDEYLEIRYQLKEKGIKEQKEDKEDEKKLFFGSFLQRKLQGVPVFFLFKIVLKKGDNCE